MSIYLLALLIGVVAGLRAMTAPAAISWAAHLGIIDLSDSWLGFMGYRFTPWIFTLLALAELVSDQLPSTPSRKVPPQLITRILMGALSGGAIGYSVGALAIGGTLGGVGAVIGTLGGASARGMLARGFGRDLPAALIEDVVAIAAVFAIVSVL
jgi:uncharacterized membrane protein